MGTTTGYLRDKYDEISGSIYNGMQRRSRRRKHSLTISSREFQLWCKSQDRFIPQCEEWIKNGRKPYCDTKPSINRLDDNKPYTFDNMEVISWKEHKEYTSKSRLEGHGKNKWPERHIVVLKDNEVEFIALNTYDAARRLGAPTPGSAATKINNICKGVGPNKSFYGRTFKYKE